MSTPDEDKIRFIPIPTSAFHVEFDYYKTEEYNTVLVVPNNGNYVIICNNEHLGTLAKKPENDGFWEAVEGNFNYELLERIGAAIDNYALNYDR